MYYTASLLNFKHILCFAQMSETHYERYIALWPPTNVHTVFLYILHGPFNIGCVQFSGAYIVCIIFDSVDIRCPSIATTVWIIVSTGNMLLWQVWKIPTLHTTTIYILLLPNQIKTPYLITFCCCWYWRYDAKWLLILLSLNIVGERRVVLFWIK